MNQSILITLGLITALSACQPTNFGRESGDMDNGTFGNATMHNSLMMMGAPKPIQTSAGKYDGPIADRKLSGKYATVIMGEYATNATRTHPSNSTISSQVSTN